MNNKGFMATSIIYSFMLVFMAFLLTLVVSYAHNRILVNNINNKSKNNISEYNLYSKDTSGAADPSSYLGDLTPVVYYYDSEEEMYKARYANVTNENWFNYSKQIWANAVLLKSGATATIGSDVNNEDVIGYFVWIPRFKYRLFNNNFDNILSNINGVSIIFENDQVTSDVNGNVNGTYYTHPAFTYYNEAGGAELKIPGFWIAKYETYKNNQTIYSLPGKNLSSFSDIETSLSESILFYNYSANGLDLASHMLKDNQWGAVSYLSFSNYGIKGNKDVLSKFPVANTTVITGGGVVTNNDNYLNQSTTGNIYGVYDMVGGKGEKVLTSISDASLSQSYIFPSDTISYGYLYDNYSFNCIFAEENLNNNQACTAANGNNSSDFKLGDGIGEMNYLSINVNKLKYDISNNTYNYYYVRGLNNENLSFSNIFDSLATTGGNEYNYRLSISPVGLGG